MAFLKFKLHYSKFDWPTSQGKEAFVKNYILRIIYFSNLIHILKIFLIHIEILLISGVDIPEVECVVQFDPPSNAEAFVHRCGRTARSGLKGIVILTGIDY